MSSVPTIQDKAPKPPGLLPKNVQSWLLVSLAVLMVLIMWLTGGKKPAIPSRSIPLAPTVQAPLEVNEAKIVDLQNRIQELQREQIVAQNAIAQQTRPLAGDPGQPALPQAGPVGGAAPERAEDSIQEERKKRDYLSLFASNVALSYRKNPQMPPIRENESNPPTPNEPPQLPDWLKPLQPPAAAPSPAPKDSAADSDRKEEPKKSPAAPAGAPAAAAGKKLRSV